MPIEKAAFLTIMQLGRIGGFDDYLWPKDRIVAARMIGNSVAPPVATQVMLAARDAGLLSYTTEEMKIPRCALNLNLRVEAAWLVDSVSSAPSGMAHDRWGDDMWREAAQKAKEKAMAADSGARIKAITPTHPMALFPSRMAQAPWLRHFRAGCEKRGLFVASPLQERRQALGFRGASESLKGDRALITASSSRPLIQEAIVRIRNLAENMEKGTTHKNVALCGIWRPIAGWPNSQLEHWKDSGAAKEQLHWLRHGHNFCFKRPPAPTGCGARWARYNHTGAREHAAYLEEVWAEYIVLGIVRELSYVPACLGRLNVISKGDYDPSLEEKKHRLRILLDEEDLNLDLQVTRYRAETLHRARWVIQEGDVMLMFDFSAYFLHFLAATDERQLLGSTFGPDGPFGGRWWGWNVAPMGVASSCYQTQSFSWVLMRKYRRLGLRGLSYSDDTNLFCKEGEAEEIARFIKEDFRRHGLLRSTKTLEGGQLRGVILGTGVDLAARPMIFFVPEDKKKDIVQQAREIIAESTKTPGGTTEKSCLIRARRLASITGKLMATGIVTGNTSRLMTRACYAQIARETGVPVDATKRELKVAWDVFIQVDEEALDELRFWVQWLPGHKGTPIHPEEVRAVVVLGQDVSDTAWGGFFDDGSGTRTLSRGLLRAGEETQSSTMRELKAAERNVDTFSWKAHHALAAANHRLRQQGKSLASRHVLVYTDNQTSARDGNVGSKDPELQRIIRKIHATAMQHSFTVVFRWRRRNTKDMQLADDITKIDMCDFRFCRRRFEELQRDWDVMHSLDGFATSANTLLERFYADLPCPGATGVDFFKEPLRGEDLWVHPPRALIGQAISRMQCCRALGTVLVPAMPEAIWWPLVVEGATGTCCYPNTHATLAGQPLRRVWKMEDGLLTRGGTPVRAGSHDLLAVRLDFTKSNKSTHPPWKRASDV
jgi:hypothetical protein